MRRPRLRQPASRLLLTALVLAAACALRWQPARAEAVVHIVQPGENLFRIGLAYGVSWVAIMDANGLRDTTIYVGQTLVIPMDSAAPAAPGTPASSGTPASPDAPATPDAPAPTGTPDLPAAATPEAAATPAVPETAATYVVQTGDTLFQIAARYGASVAAIAAANGLTDPSLIYAGQTLYLPSAGAAPAAGNGKQIVISLSEQHLYAYDNGALIYSFVVSTGEPGAETWPGSYSVLDKIPNAYGANWDLWMPNWLGIYWAGDLENGIHALPILSNGQRLWDGYLGTPVSYGCIILGVADSQTIYDWADVGTPVYIKY